MPGFPYIEASSGRINFKAGPEKKPYALLNADFAVWQESENEWGVRLKAEPLRTDMSLSDTGLLRMNGTWQRAGSLRETPLQFSLEWRHAQLGQLSKLVSGNDKGGGATLQVEAALSGTPAAMQVAADASIQDFHRYDISSQRGTGAWQRTAMASTVRQKTWCAKSSAAGLWAMAWSRCTAMRAGRELHKLDLSLNVENVPVSAVAQLARRAKKDLPADLAATGSVQGNFGVKEDGASPRGPEFRGRGEISDLRLAVVRVRKWNWLRRAYRLR